MERYRHTGEEPLNWRQFVNKADKDLAALTAECYWKGKLTDLSEQEKEHVMNEDKAYLEKSHLTLLNERAVEKKTDHLSASGIPKEEFPHEIRKVSIGRQLGN